MATRKRASKRALLIGESVEIAVAPARKRRLRGIPFSIQGTEWRVYLVSRRSAGALKGLEGLCVFEEAAIFIAKELAPARRVEVFVHEVLHALNFSSGIDRVIPQALGVTAAQWDAAEETMVRLLAPVLVDTLTRNGLLSIPAGLL